MRKLAAFVCAGLVASGAAAFADPPAYTAMKAGCPMAMDGVLNEPAWQKAQPMSPFVFPWYESGEQEQTETKIVWDNERIYIAFKCSDKNIWADHFRQNDPVYLDDTGEAFICPVADGPEKLDYINYEINCLGTWKVGYHAKSRNKDLPSWNDPWGIEIGRYISGTVNKDDDTDEGWVLEFSIPWSHFSEFGAKFPPKNGQVIHVGLHRIGGKTNQQYSQWAPSSTPQPQYHSPKDFGAVTFSTKVLK